MASLSSRRGPDSVGSGHPDVACAGDDDLRLLPRHDRTHATRSQEPDVLPRPPPVPGNTRVLQLRCQLQGAHRVSAASPRPRNRHESEVPYTKACLITVRGGEAGH